MRRILCNRCCGRPCNKHVFLRTRRIGHALKAFFPKPCAAAESGENQAGWCDRAFDTLIAQARREAEQEKRAALYRQALAIFHEQAPWIALAHPKQFVALRKGVEGFVLSPLGSNNFARVKLP